MTFFSKEFLAVFIWICLSLFPNGLMAQTPTESDCRQTIVLLKEQNVKLSEDLRRIQREIAALRADLNKPGMRDIIAGIGYILGIFGAVAFVAARRKE